MWLDIDDYVAVLHARCKPKQRGLKERNSWIINLQKKLKVRFVLGFLGVIILFSSDKNENPFFE